MLLFIKITTIFVNICKLMHLLWEQSLHNSYNPNSLGGKVHEFINHKLQKYPHLNFIKQKLYFFFRIPRFISCVKRYCIHSLIANYYVQISLKWLQKYYFLMFIIWLIMIFIYIYVGVQDINLYKLALIICICMYTLYVLHVEYVSKGNHIIYLNIAFFYLNFVLLVIKFVPEFMS